VSTDQPIPTTRRTLLAAGLGSLVAAIGAALGRPLTVRAADGQNFVLGQTNSATSTTRLNTDATNGLLVVGAAGTTNAIKGTSGSNVGAGVLGVADSGSFAAGVYGSSDVGVGVRADTTTGDAVWAVSSGAGSRAIYAQGPADGYAVYAEAGEDVIYAHSTGSGGGTAVTAFSETGVGIFATSDATNNAAILAETSKQTAVAAYYGDRGLSTGAAKTAIYAQAAAGGTALRTVGPVRFSSAGLATIPAGTRSVTVNPGLDITASSKILALPQTNPGGTTTVQRIFRNTTANTFTIWLTANATANTAVAWFLIS
jgi:hypothetical protein